MRPGEGEPDGELLHRALDAAGEVALRHFRTDGRHWDKGPGQVVTEADLEIDGLLYDLITGACPADGWLSEERVDDRLRLERQRVWIVDPIDGTRAFVQGLAQFAISIGLVVDGVARLGGIFNPATGERFVAIQGGGAWLDGVRVRTGPCTQLTGARLLSSRTELNKRNWPALAPEAAFTAIGSLAYKLALIAAGRFDGLVSLRPCHDWDIAAACVLIEEAGGEVGDAAGTPLVLNRPDPRHGSLAVAGSRPLREALVTRLAAVSPDVASLGSAQ